MKKLLVFDGNSILNRAYYAIRPLSNSGGVMTNAVFGFMNILFKHLDERKPDFLCVAFDLKAPIFRHKEYDLYKAQRKPMPEDLAQQLPHLKEVLAAMNVLCLEAEGYEADDIIGTVSDMCEKEGVWCGIVTGDKDDLQLASPTTAILLTTTRMGQTIFEDLDDKGVFEKYSVTPQEFLQVKGLMGDSSDNIPGVSGIGEKTAFDLIKKFHSIENLYGNLDSPDIKAAVRAKLENGRDMASLSLGLATIFREVPLNITVEDARVKDYNREALFQKLSELELKKLIERLDLSAPVAVPVAVEEPRAADETAMTLAKEGGEFAFLIKDGGVEFDAGGKTFAAPADALRPLFEDSGLKKITHGLKNALRELDRLGIPFSGETFDVEIAEYLLNPARKGYDFESLCAEHALPACAAGLRRLKEIQDEQILQNNQRELLYGMEFPLERVLYSMEKSGFAIDRGELERFGEKLGQRLGELESAVYFMAGGEFNINSPKQLGKVLFEDLGLCVVKKTKTGYSTDNEVLEKLCGKHEIIDYIMEYRHVAKLKSTYADGLLSVIAPDGRIHSTLNQTVTATGRISSTEPNLQNIPVRTELGRELRKMFVAQDGDYRLAGADYSQIELRVLAHISGDETMRRAFLEDVDIHTATAAQIFGVWPDMVTGQMRDRAKTVNFGIIYGQGEFSLAQQLKISRKEAKAYIDNYFDNFSGVRAYMEETIARAKKDGYVTTMFGRRRYVPEISSKNFNLRAFGERVAMNAPIQGSAADIIKLAMVRVHEELQKRCPRSRLILQVHDELLVEAHRDELEEAARILKDEMENAAQLAVPLKADVKTGGRWYDTK